MTITFNRQDRQLIRQALLDAGLEATYPRILALTDAVRSAFAQQLADEVKYLITLTEAYRK